MFRPSLPALTSSARRKLSSTAATAVGVTVSAPPHPHASPVAEPGRIHRASQVQTPRVEPQEELKSRKRPISAACPIWFLQHPPPPLRFPRAPDRPYAPKSRSTRKPGPATAPAPRQALPRKPPEARRDR